MSLSDKTKSLHWPYSYLCTQIQYMSNFARRLKYYGIGFGLGIVFVVFFFQNRGCSWTPANRVKTVLLERVIALPESQEATMKLKKTEDLLKFIEDADIDFKASKKVDPNKYYKLTNGETTLYFTLTTESFITSVFSRKPKAIDTRIGKAKLIRFPEGKDLIFTDTTGSMQRVRMELGFKNDQAVFKQMKKNAVLIYDKSDFLTAIKPEHYLEFTTKKGEQVGLVSVWYKDKINVTKYVTADSLQGYTE